MWRAIQPVAIAYLKSGQHDLFLNVLGNQSSHFDQPVLAYKRCCRDILYHNSGLKLVLKYSAVNTKNNVKYSTVVVQPVLKYEKNNSWRQ